MSEPVTVDEFLVLEEAERRQARLRASAREVRRFHAAVRRFATAWCTDVRRRIAVESNKQGVYLQLELEDRYGWVPVLSLRAVHARGEFCLRGPYPGGQRRLSSKLRKALDQLHKTWKGMPGAEDSGDRCVTVQLPKLADAGFDRFLQGALDLLTELEG
jgi:hypothetical protein